MINKLNIVLIGFFPGYGGAEKSMIKLANGMHNSGHKITIIALKENNIVYEINKSIKFIFIPDKSKLMIRKTIQRFKNLKTQLKNINPDIVISYWMQPIIFSVILSKKTRFKTIYSERGDPSDKEYKGLLGIIRKIYFKKIDGFVFQTLSARNYFSSEIINKSVVIHNPVEIIFDKLPSKKKRDETIVTVGRLHHQKNQELLINSFNLVSKEFPTYKLEIYGEGPLENALKNQVKNLNLEEKIIFKGTTKDLYSEIYNAAIFVLSSNYEGMPNALLEAMALGIPSISTNWKPGGVYEIINNNANGIIVENKSADSLADAMMTLISNPDLSNKISNEARKIQITHSTERNLSAWFNFINNLMNN